MSAKKEAVILFADVIGCSEISNALPIESYADFLKQFHSACRTSFDAIQSAENLTMKIPDECEFVIRGDECCIILHKTIDNSLEIEWAIRFALTLNLHWLISQYNIENAKKGVAPIELSIGIHQGPIYYDKFNNNIESSEGYCINLAKRIEGIAKSGGTSKIYLSEHAYLKILPEFKLYTKFHDIASQQEQLKGINTPIKIRELINPDRELFLNPPIISQNEFESLQFVSSALPKKDWLKLLVDMIQTTSRLPPYIEDIRRKLDDSLGVYHFITKANEALDKQEYDNAALAICRALRTTDLDNEKICQVLTLRARIHFENQHYDDTIQWSKLAIKHKHDYTPAYYYLIESLYKQQKYEESRLLSEIVTEINVNYWMPYDITKGYFWLKSAEMLSEKDPSEKEIIKERIKAAKGFEAILNITQNQHLLKAFTSSELSAL